MSELSYLEKLLGGAEVQWLPLGDIATIRIGEFVRKDKQVQGAEYPV